MHCDEFVELVTAYLDGALDADDHARMVEHLSLCDACTMYLDQVRATIGELTTLPADPVDREVKKALLSAFRTHTEKDPGPA
ncbi:zf-HC2 domain-containing protein [Antrihabitans cavernicola]|uniref:Zf-HC2 domain-containing protein n=2 Tax=Antrihabitans cavernicola TaxID=2495913 RepID=A0A5A7S673_9NOCA|nr:zf-HC2 domain-containing protein [Spelaeibacter cavernicola]